MSFVLIVTPQCQSARISTFRSFLVQYPQTHTERDFGFPRRLYSIPAFKSLVSSAYTPTNWCLPRSASVLWSLPRFFNAFCVPQSSVFSLPLYTCSSNELTHVCLNKLAIRNTAGLSISYYWRILYIKQEYWELWMSGCSVVAEFCQKAISQHLSK